jgi:hypothetical protein
LIPSFPPPTQHAWALSLFGRSMSIAVNSSQNDVLCCSTRA